MNDSTAERQIRELWNEVVTLRKERDHYIALSAMNNAEALRNALTRALRLLRIGMDVGLEPHEKDEANRLLVLFGEGELFTKSMNEILGVDMARGPDRTAVTAKCERCGMLLCACDVRVVEVPLSEGPKPYCKCSLDGQRWLPEECPIHRLSDPTTSPL